MKAPYENELEAVEDVRIYINAVNVILDELRRCKTGTYGATHQIVTALEYINKDYNDIRGDLSVTPDGMIQKKSALRYALRHARVEALAEVGKEMARLLENA